MSTSESSLAASALSGESLLVEPTHQRHANEPKVKHSRARASGAGKIPGFFLSAPGGGPVYESTLFSRLTLHSVWMPWPGIEPVESAVTPLLLPCRFVSLSLLMALLCRVLPHPAGVISFRQFSEHAPTLHSVSITHIILKRPPFYVRRQTKSFTAISVTIATMSSTFHHMSRI